MKSVVGGKAGSASSDRQKHGSRQFPIEASRIQPRHRPCYSVNKDLGGNGLVLGLPGEGGKIQ